jgi:hypothetical protein
MVEKSPFELHKKLLRAYTECNDYFSELSEFKIKQLERGETTEKGTMDVMGKYCLAILVADFNWPRSTRQSFREKPRRFKGIIPDEARSHFRFMDNSLRRARNFSEHCTLMFVISGNRAWQAGSHARRH